MTDWCLSQIEFSGPVSVISQLTEGFKRTTNDAEYQLFGQTFLPRPQEIETQSRSAAWYEWTKENWGCKYANGLAQSEVRQPGLVKYILKTDWNPPVVGLCKLTTMPEYSNITVRVDYEMQADFCDPFEFHQPDGYLVIRHGEVIEDVLINHQKVWVETPC